MDQNCDVTLSKGLHRTARCVRWGSLDNMITMLADQNQRSEAVSD